MRIVELRHKLDHAFVHLAELPGFQCRRILLTKRSGRNVTHEFSLTVFVVSEQLSEANKARLALIAVRKGFQLEIGHDRIAFHSDSPIEEDDLLAEISTMVAGDIPSPVIDPESPLSWDGRFWIARWNWNEPLPWATATDDNSVRVLVIPDDSNSLSDNSRSCFDRLWANLPVIIKTAKDDILRLDFSDVPPFQLWPDEICIQPSGEYCVYFIADEYRDLRISYSRDGQVLD